MEIAWVVEWEMERGGWSGVYLGFSLVKWGEKYGEMAKWGWNRGKIGVKV